MNEEGDAPSTASPARAPRHAFRTWPVGGEPRRRCPVHRPEDASATVSVPELSRHASSTHAHERTCSGSGTVARARRL